MKKKSQILIVDDERLVAADLSHTLETLGYDVIGAASSGEEALNILSGSQPQLVLMDIIIQGEMTGIEASQIIKDRYDIPIVFLTAHTDEKTLDEAKVTGPYGYLIKPFEASELKTTIELALYKHNTERELRESEAWFSTTFRSIGDGVIVTNANGVITFLNPYSSMLTGYSMEEAVNHSLDDIFFIFTERDHKPIKGFVQDVLKRGEVSELVDSTVMQSRDGRTIPIDISFSPVKSVSGEITGVVLVFHDTLDRKLTEEALRESEERYRTIFEESRDAIYIVTRKGYFVIVNQSLLNLFQLDREAILERHITDFFVDKQQWHHFINNVDKFGAERDIPVLMRGQNEVNLECLLSASLRKSPEDKVLGYQGIIRDMTDRNRAERAMRRSEQRYRLLAENIMDIIWTLDNDLKFTFVSPSAINLLGYSTEELLNLYLHDLCDTASYEIIMLKFAHVFSESATVPVYPAEKTIELTLKRKNGEDIWVDISFTPLKDESTARIGILGVVHDVSRRKDAEIEKDRMHSQLLQAQKMEAVGLLAGGVAHDFNNLLTVIQGNTDLAMMNLDPEDMLYSDLQEIYKASQRAAELTSQLLLFSRKQPMRLVSLNVNNIIEDLLKMLHRLIGEDVEIITNLASELKYVKADRGSIEQVVMNLAVNARDAMPNGGEFKIRSKNVKFDNSDIRHMPDGREGDFIELIIEDQGIGMSDEVIERIFEPFFSTKGRGRGTGLGLSVVYGIVKQHSGWIYVSSREGHGTVFNIYLPINLEHAETPRDRYDKVTEIKGHGELIMVIEDESGVRHLTTKALTEHGYRVISAQNAEEARSTFKENRNEIDAIVSDVVLPDGTGVELVGEFLEKNPDMPVLLCSGYTDQKSQWETIQEKGYPFLQKPFNITDLLHHVQNIINKTSNDG
ncbi:PAS domain S-box protein [bacterium]|nr:PAS domain S-box protein [bacterium]